MGDIGPPAWWLLAPLVTIPLAAWKVVDLVMLAAHHITFQ